MPTEFFDNVILKDGAKLFLETLDTNTTSTDILVVNATEVEKRAFSTLSTNIYNSNGTLTGNRILTGANFDLTLDGLEDFAITGATTILLNAEDITLSASRIFMENFGAGDISTNTVILRNPITNQLYELPATDFISSTPDLQTVTSTGNTTTIDIILDNSNLVFFKGGNNSYLTGINLTDTRTIYLPDVDGIIPIIINGQTSDAAGIVSISLQDVTNVSNVTTGGITADNFTSLGDITIGNNSLSGAINWYNGISGIVSTLSNPATAARVWLMPDASGTLALTSDITSLTLQDVTDVGNITTNDIFTPAIHLVNGSFSNQISSPILSGNIVNILPNTSGTLVSSVNNQAPSATGAVSINLQQVTAVGSVTTIPITVDDIYIGKGAHSVTITYSTAIGTNALSSNTTGDENTSVGYGSLASNTVGFENTAVGFGALFTNIGGDNNSAFGMAALNKNTTGFYNTAIGSNSLHKNTTGFKNTAVGFLSQEGMLTGSDNVSIGYASLYRNQDGIRNVAIGYEALENGTTGSYNIGVGADSIKLTTGSYNIGIGAFAGFDIGASAVTGSRNIAIGYQTYFPSVTDSYQLNIGNMIYGVNIDGAGSTLSTGNIGLAVKTPTARLHIIAGTATAGTAPLKLSTGTALTTPEDGAIEYHSSHLYFTIGSTRYQLDQQSSGTVTSFTFTNGGGFTGTVTNPTTTPTLSLVAQDAAADGTTKGFATFTAADFNSSSGVISIDYTNGQAASGSAKGFLTSADWTTFNSKLSSITLAAIGSSPNANGATYSAGTLNLEPASASFGGVVTTGAQTLAGAKTFSSAPIFSTMTAGSVLFAGTSGTLTQDNANLFFDDTNNRLGVGTAAPASIFHIKGTSDTYLTIESSGANTLDRAIMFKDASSNIRGLIDLIPNTSANTATLNFFVGSASGTNNTLSGDGLGRWNIGSAAGGVTRNAYLNFAAGTSSIAPLQLNTGTDLTTAVAGSFEFGSSRLAFTPSGTTRKRVVLSNDVTSSNGQIPIGNGTDYTVATLTAGTGITVTNASGSITVAASSGTLYTNTATATIAATTTPTSAIGSGVGSLTVSAATAVVGKQWRLKLRGVYSTPALSVGNVTIDIKLGSVTIATGTANSLVAAATNLGFEGECIVTCRSTGATGTVMTTGAVKYDAATSNAAQLNLSMNNGTSTNTIDFTAANAFDVVVTWSNSTVGNSISGLNFSLEVLN
jgi:hypothetical protein